MTKVTKELGVMRVRAKVDENSFNEDSRSVDVVFVTETPVLIRHWDGDFFEILSTEKRHIRTQRSNNGLPVLDDHNQYSGVVKGILGRARNITYSEKQGRATIFFSKRSELDGFVGDVKDNITSDISVGYKVYSYISEGTHEGLPLLRAIDWEPSEISFALIPKDVNSGVRSSRPESNIYEVTILNTNTMEVEETAGAGAEGQRSEKPATPATPIAKVEIPTPGARSESEIVKEERTRSAGITNAVRAAKLDPSFAEELIRSDKTLDQAKAAILDKYTEGDAGAGQRSAAPVVTADASDKMRSGMEEALLARSNPASFKMQAGNEFRGMTLVDMAKETLIASGVSVRGMTPKEAATFALGINQRSGMHTTSDFPIILGNTVNRVLRKAYEITPRTFMPIASQGVAKDFRDMTKVQMSELSGFSKVVEGAEYTFGTFSESKEVYAVSKYGKIYSISWEMIVNDDLNAFNRIPASIGNKAAQNQSNIVWGIINANPNMGDGNALFSAAHNNLAGAGAALSIASLAAGKAAMREQKDASGDLINVVPKFLVVGSANELLANQYTSQVYVPNDQTKINPAYNTSLEVIVEPRITGNKWFLVADPSQIDTIEYSYLEGEGDLYIEQKQGFEVDGLMIKARSTFGAKALDWRGMYMNPGQ